jgi:uncharacterized protein YtpQ (UPF0354 family)
MARTPGSTLVLMLWCAAAAAADCPIEPRAFQAEVLAMLKQEYPKRAFKPGNSPDVIVTDKIELGLSNIRSRLCLASPPLSAKERVAAARAHFRSMLSVADQGPTARSEDWARVQDRVMLQLMPAAYLQKFQDDRALVSRPFIPGVATAVVIDGEKGYRYVRKLDLVQWKMGADALFERAVKNLETRSKAAKLEASRGSEKFLVFEEKDGYDAARLLLPSVRSEAARLLGDPFLAALPNRDFLILWSAQNGAGFQKFTRQKARDEYKAQPYPLSPSALRVWQDGRVEVTQ